MNALDYTFWLRLIAAIAVQSALVVCAAFISQRFLASVFWRRTVWQIATICLLAVFVAEMTGASKAVALWLGGKSPDQPRVTVAILSEASARTKPLPAGETFSSMAMMTTAEVANAVSWPVFVWGAGICFIALRVGFSQFLLLLIRLRRHVVHHVSVQGIAAKLGWCRQITLRESAGLTSPIAFGVLCPTIALPSGFRDKFSPQEQEVMLAHEVAHLASHDPAWYLFADVVTAILWWNPCVWLIRRQLHHSSESVADEATAVIENGPAILAECLVSLARTISSERGFSRLGVEGNGFRSNLGRRVAQLLHAPHGWIIPSGGRMLAAKIIAPLLGLGLVVICSAWKEQDSVKPQNFTAAFNQSWQDSPVLLALNSVKVSGDANRSKTWVGTSAPPPAAVAIHKTNLQVMVSATILRVRPNAHGKAKDPVTRLTDSILTNDVLSESQVKLLLVGLPYRDGFEKLATPRLTNLSGQEGELSIFKEMTNAGRIYSEGLAVRVTPDVRDERIELKVGFHAGEFTQDGKFIDGSGPAAGKTVVMKESQTALISCTNNAADEYYVLLTVQQVTPEGRLIRQRKSASTNDLQSPSVNPLEVEFSKAQTLIKDGQLLYEMGRINEAEQKLREATRLTSQDEKAAYYLNLLKERQSSRSAAVATTLNNAEPAQVTIEFKLVEVDEVVSKKLGLDWFLKGSPTTANVTRSNTVAGILPDRSFRAVLKALEQEKGINVLNGPRVTTLSSRQAQIGILDSPVKAEGVIRVEDIETKTNTYLTNATLSGITLDIIPEVSPDRFSIDLTLVPAVTEFLGYEALEDGSSQGHARTRRFFSNIKIWDGETVVLGHMPELAPLAGGRDGATRHLVAFVTATIIDKVGNRVHTEEDLKWHTGRPPR